MIQLADIETLIQNLKKIEQRPAPIVHSQGEKEISSQSLNPPIDSAEISVNGKSLLKESIEVANYVKELESVETTPEETIEEIQKKIESDQYATSRIESKFLDSLLAYLTMKDMFVGYENNNIMKEYVNSENDNRDRLISEIREKINNGDYDTEEVMSEIIELLLS